MWFYFANSIDKELLLIDKDMLKFLLSKDEQKFYIRFNMKDPAIKQLFIDYESLELRDKDYSELIKALTKKEEN